MWCVSKLWFKVWGIHLSPSPGGDVLCHQSRHAGAALRLGCRPLAGMCCVESAMSDQYLGAIVSVPWRGCVVSPGLPQYVLLKGSFRPLAGMWYVLLKHLRKTLSPKCFRPLAGMCCVVPFTALALLAICLRPLAGMCCVDAQGRELTADKSPSPGGDALCPRLAG